MSTSIVQHSWALALVSIAGRIEGITRLHKYAFLIAQQNKKIVDEVGFYNDWEPSHYGPFSKCLAKDIYELENKGLIKNTPTENEYGYLVGVLEPTEAGQKEIKSFLENNKRYTNSVKKIIEQYNDKPLIDILHDVYSSYPKYASNSRIRDKVNGGMKKFESDYFLNPQEVRY